MLWNVFEISKVWSKVEIADFFIFLWNLTFTESPGLKDTFYPFLFSVLMPQ